MSDASAGAGESGAAGSSGVELLCLNGRYDSGETGVDCGGSCSARCVAGQGCEQRSDCVLPLACVANVCQESRCDDHVQNGGETDRDCGGASCRSCSPGQGCIVDADCTTGVCGTALGGTCAEPSCSDTVPNGDETDVDCGGDTCGPCGIGQRCQLMRDCAEDEGVSCAPDVRFSGADCSGAESGNCLCDECGEALRACNANANCREVFACFAGENCPNSSRCFGAGEPCSSIVTRYGGPLALEVRLARALLDCAADACVFVCQ